ncbi:T9SS type A sorting domain-containing protein [Psychroserpens jangbogonensis]|uniref:T9SS type A sorting domain-containing protein n=1 Tax=Psychroserpens jangbogonensis TaxID=1484460 RepID=UPI00053DDAF0|nr:T9SS type A sorting domain-containing protein [Psychroserpens jangbogonensis]
MKKIYFTVTLLCLGLISFSQEEVALFGDWYLHFRTDNGVTTYPPLTTQEDYNIVLNFGLLPPTADEPFTIESFGPITDTFEGKFNVANGTMEVFDITEALSNCENPPEVCSYFSDYNHAILFDSNTSEILDEFILSYDITGTDDDTTLTITNDFSGDYAVYGRQTLSISSFQYRTIAIYPNPAKEVLHISNFLISSHYSIYSITGKLIESNSNLSESIDVSYLKAGLYFLKIDDKQIIKFIKL